MFKFSYKAHYYTNILCGLAILIRVILVYYDTKDHMIQGLR